MKFQKITIQEIQDSVLITKDAKEWAIANMDYLNKPMQLFGSSLKVEKGEKAGYKTAILYLQPAGKVSVKTLCAAAALFGCEKACLISSGQLGMQTGQFAATKRTILFLLRKDSFINALNAEIRSLHKKHGNSLAIRLNGTSDIDWHDVIAANPETRFYDYSKIYARIAKNKLPNYDLTFSGSAYSDRAIAMTARAIQEGKRTVLAFNTKQLQGEFQIPGDLENFDDTDLRFLDHASAIGALKRKGSSKEQRAIENGKDSFFFNAVTYQKLNNIIARG